MDLQTLNPQIKDFMSTLRLFLPMQLARTFRRLFKDLLCNVGLGYLLIEYCNRCGRKQPLVWWCKDNALWIEVNGTSAGALCLECFDSAACRLGYFIRWYPAQEGERLSHSDSHKS
jgi:hypothetical protein